MKMNGFWWCCDAGDIIDGRWCIIRVTRGGNVNRFLPGVGVHVNDRKEGTTGREKWLEFLQKRKMCAPHGQ